MKKLNHCDSFNHIQKCGYLKFPKFNIIKIISVLLTITVLLSFASSCSWLTDTNADGNRIKPYSKNSRYWQFKGSPVMLLGANKTDSPYLLPDQESYYDSLITLGGNYTRYNVKQRLEEGLIKEFPHKKLPDGTYDLNQWNEDYWIRFEQGLTLTRDKNIIVQLELWDRFDVGSGQTYQVSPWRPANNQTYSEVEAKLPSVWEGGDSMIHKHPFYNSVPALENNQILLSLQQKFADKVLSISLKYDHVLYAITNESTLNPEWSDFWAKYIHSKAKEANKNVEVSEMPWTIADDFPFEWQKLALGDPNKWINHVIGNTKLYSYCAFQFQPIFKSGQEHYDRIVEIYERIGKEAAGPRPVNAVKIFARQRIINGIVEPNAQTRFWRPLLAGWAAVSLHREHANSGYLGFSITGRRNLSAARKFCDAIIPWECTSRQELILNREADEAYLMANPGNTYGVYFPTFGSVDIDVKNFAGSNFTLRWISIESGEFHEEPITITPGAVISLTTPESGSNAGWACTLVIK